jgi:transposase
MYVAVTGSGKARVIQFVEQHRIPGTTKKKTKVIRTIGNYEAMLAENPNILEELRAEAKRLTEEKKARKAPVVLRIENQEIHAPQDALASLRFGHCLGLKLWRTMGFDRLFRRRCTKKNLSAIIKAIQGLLCHRIGQPRSVLGTYGSLDDYAGFGDIGLDVHYQALEVLADLKEAITDHLCRFFERETTRRGPMAYYDVTTYYFESVRQGELRMFGFSKDNKHQEVQVVMGLLLDNNGIPISFELFPGNTMDKKTLTQAVESLKQRYNLDKIVVVADRGLNGQDNLEMLLDDGHDFVVGFSLRKAGQDLRTRALDSTGWRVTQTSRDGEVLFMEKTVDYTWETRVLMSEAERAALSKKRGRKPLYKKHTIDATLHVTWSADRAEKDRADRMRAVEKAAHSLREPGKIKSSLKRGKNQYLTFDVNTQDMQLDEARIESQARFDGYYAVLTNDKERTNAEVCAMYRGLWQIEESFRVLKTDLRARPVFVWNDRRVQGHFTLCFIALCMIRYLQHKLPRDPKSGRRATTADIRESFLEPSVLVVGEGALPQLMPMRVTETYLSIAKLLNMPNLHTVMTRSQFKRATGLEIEVNLNKINGQVERT